MAGTEQQTKMPMGVYIIGLIFLLSPLANILFSLYSSGESAWYILSNAMASIQGIYWFEWIWLSLLSLVGVLLLKNHRTSWLMAMFALTLIIFLNIYRFFYPPAGQANFADIYLVSSVLATGAMWILAFYFRYPYIDRRSQWLMAPANRYETRTSVQVLANDIYDGITESISISGVRVILQRDLGESQAKMRFMDILLPNIQNIKITCEVVDYTGNVLRMRFRRLHSKNRAILMSWLKSQDGTA